MSGSPRLRAVAFAALVSLTIACRPRHERLANEAIRVDVHAHARLLAVVHADGSIAIRRLVDGSVVSRIARYDDRPRPYAVDYELPRCPTQLSDNGLLVVDYAGAVRVYDTATGRRLANLSMPRSGVGRACSSIGPDSKILVHAPAYHGSGFLMKLDRRGAIVFRAALPDIGPLVGSIEVDEATGDAIVTSRTHVVSLGPDGHLNWAHRQRDPGTRR